jgi:predicted nuclease with TOPRIM domain
VRDPRPIKAERLTSLADELLERLARLEEQMTHVLTAVEKLSNRDSELEVSLRNLSERFSQALDAQAETFRSALNDLTLRFVSREDWMFWKSLLVAALLSLTAYGWSSLMAGQHLPH